MELTSLAVLFCLHGAAAAQGTATQHLREVTIHAANDESYSPAVGSTATKKPQFGETLGDLALGLDRFGFKRATADVKTPAVGTTAFRLDVAAEDSDSYRHPQFTKRHSLAPSLDIKPGFNL